MQQFLTLLTVGLIAENLASHGTLHTVGVIDVVAVVIVLVLVAVAFLGGIVKGIIS